MNCLSVCGRADIVIFEPLCHQHVGVVSAIWHRVILPKLPADASEGNHGLAGALDWNWIVWMLLL